MVDFVFRPARRDDIAAISAIFYAQAVESLPHPPPQPASLPEYAHVLAYGVLWVAEFGDELVGFAGSMRHGDVVFLTDLFVRVAHQSAGVGSRLLRQVLPSGVVPTLCTSSSADPRALGLYLRVGMRPYWPVFLLSAEVAHVKRPSTDTIVCALAAGDDDQFSVWDAEIGGRLRPHDHAFWRQHEEGQALWFLRNGVPIGYGYVRLRASAIAHTQVARLGPLGVRRAEDAVACVAAAIRWAQPHASTLHVDIFGPHPALPFLLERGFQIADVDTFMCTSAPFFDPTRYIGSGGMLL